MELAVEVLGDVLVLLDLLVPFRSSTCPIADFLRARRALDVVGADPKGISGEDQLAALALDLLAGPIADRCPKGNVAPRWRR